MFLQRVEGEEKLKTLVGQLERDDPGYFFIIELLKVTIQFQHPRWEIYTLVDETDTSNNDGNTEDTFIPCLGVLCADQGPDFSLYGFYSKQRPDALMSAIKEKVDWSKMNIFMFVSRDFTPLLHQINNEGTLLEHKGFTYVLHHFRNLPELPEGNTGKNAHGEYEIRKIREDFTSTVNENWVHRMEGSELLIREELQLGYGYGLFVDGRMVSWIIARKFGSMGILFTLPEFRGRGYASLVVSALSRDLSALKMTVYVNIEENNVASLKFFEKLGFERGPAVDYIFCPPKPKE